MAEANELANSVYSDLCAALDRRGWRYQRHDEDLVITFIVSGDDIPMEFLTVVDPRYQILSVYSRIPVTVPEDKRMDLAVATCVATNGLADGCFDYDISKGIIQFRLTASFRDSKIGDGLFQYLISCSTFVVDEFNDKFLFLSKGLISLNDFITSR